VKDTKQYADETNTDKQDKMLKGSYAQWTVYMLMKNSDQGKYGLLMMSLTTQFSMGTNQYPKDKMAAVDILTITIGLIRQNQRTTTKGTGIGTTTIQQPHRVALTKKR
jgi:hypothetical protein